MTDQAALASPEFSDVKNLVDILEFRKLIIFNDLNG